MKTWKSIFKSKQVRKECLYSFMILMGIRLLATIPTPGTNPDYFKTLIHNNSALTFIDAMTGNGLSGMSIMALSITPYITASIMVQLAGVIYPRIHEIRSNAERQIRNIQLRFYDINQAIIFRVGDHVRIAGHMQNRRTQDAEGNYHSTPTIVGDSIAVSKRRLTQILDESIPEQGGGAQADENWGVLAGIVTSIRTPTDKVTFLNIRIPSGRRDYNCRVTCLGRFQRAAANLKEGENVAVSCYVSVLDDTQRESRQSLVCTDLFSYGESDEAPKAPEEPTESLQPEEEANNDKNESFDPPAVPANPETGVDAFSEKTLQTANSNYEERHSENNPAHVETANAQMQYPFQRAQNNYYEETT